MVDVRMDSKYASGVQFHASLSNYCKAFLYSSANLQNTAKHLKLTGTLHEKLRKIPKLHLLS